MRLVLFTIHHCHTLSFSGVHRFQLTFECAAGGLFAVHQVDGVGPAAHAFDEVEQVFLVGVGGVAADGGDACFDIVSLVVDLDPAATRAVLLYGAAWGACALVADEQYLVAFIAQHGFEVVHDAPACAHAAGGDDHRWAACAGQVADRSLVGFVAVYGVEVGEVERVAATAQAALGFVVPVGFQLAVYLGEAGGQRRIDDDLQRLP